MNVCAGSSGPGSNASFVRNSFARNRSCRTQAGLLRHNFVARGTGRDQKSGCRKQNSENCQMLDHQGNLNTIFVISSLNCLHQAMGARQLNCPCLLSVRPLAKFHRAKPGKNRSQVFAIGRVARKTWEFRRAILSRRTDHGLAL